MVAGEWWPEDYDGPPLVSAEEDVMQAFDLKPGDELTYSVLGRVFTSRVANIRKEYHRTMRPEFLVVATPNPFRDAPHGWIVSLQAEDAGSLDAFNAELVNFAPNVTSIDVRKLVIEATEVVEGAILGTLLIASALLLAGALFWQRRSQTHFVAARRWRCRLWCGPGEIALAVLPRRPLRVLSQSVGGGAGLLASWAIVAGAIRVDWAPGMVVFFLPIAPGRADVGGGRHPAGYALPRRAVNDASAGRG